MLRLESSHQPALKRDLLMGIRLNVCNDIDIDDLDVKSQSVLTSHVLDLYRLLVRR